MKILNPCFAFSPGTPLLRRTAALLLLLPALSQAQWQTYQTNPPQSLNWVYYNPNFSGTPPNDYPGAWGIPNSWPGAGASVTIRHEIGLNNARYNPTGTPGGAVEPFPGGTVYPGDPPSTGGRLTVNSLNIQPGGWLQTTLEEFSFDGVSVWSGGAIGLGVNGNHLIHNQGQLSVTGPFVLTRGGRCMLNTEHIAISSTFGIQAGGFLTNESGQLPDDSVAEIVLTQPDAQIGAADGGGGAYPSIINYGVLRKTGPGNASISTNIVNHAESTRNRAGTIAVDSGTLLLDGDYAGHTFHGLKAEIAPGAQMVMTRQTTMEAGDTTVTGGGVLRMQPVPGNTIGAPGGVTATLSAPEGAVESAGGGGYLRNLVNRGSLNVTAPSNWWDMINEGHVRLLADVTPSGFLQNGTPAIHSAVLDMEGTASITGANQTVVNNHALLRKKGPGTSQITLNMNVFGGAAPLAGRIEVQEGTLECPSTVTFVNGGSIRVANRAAMEFKYRNYVDGGTLNVTGSGKLYLSPGSFVTAAVLEHPFIIDAAPGVFELRGGPLYGPVTNAGELYVTRTTLLFRGLGNGLITNTGTIHCTATSAGAAYSVNLAGPFGGGLTFTSSSVLSLDIAARPGQMDQWARLTVNDQWATYGGTLRVNFSNFVPVSGDRWEVVHSDTPRAENFASVQFTNVPAGFTPMFEKLANGSYRVGLDAAPAPVTYATWAAAQSFPTPAAAAFDADADGDGISNGVECALGTNPVSAASSPNMQALRKNSGGDEFFTAQFTRPGAAARATDIQWIGERSDALGGWTSAGVIMEFGALNAQGMETVTVRVAEPIDYHRRVFLRLRVQKSP